MFYLLLESILIYGKLDDNTKMLIYTSTPFMNMIKKNNLYSDKIIFEINDGYDTIDAACKSRLDLFSLQSIHAFDKILYLDIDILIKDDINKVFNICKDDILYALEEGEINSDRDFWGKTLFGDEINKYKDKDKTAFTSGILLFNNCDKIKELFNKIKKDIINRPYNFSCYDQPYIVYNAFKYNLYNNKLLKTVAVNNDYNINSDKVIHHFPGGSGVYKHKIVYMTIFLHRMNKSKFISGIKVYDVVRPPTKNNCFSLVGVCVSYNYFDTLQFMLPVNCAHFEKMYLITQPNDLETIEFCKKFENVKVLFYNFKNNNKTFDKFGAINYAQQIMYNEYPDSWYMIIDSDIILPNNFIDILSKETLNDKCIYGAIRNNVFKSSELLNKKQIVNAKDNVTWVYNNILHWKIKPPSILGCFQLYKKKCFHLNSDKFANAGFGDYAFGHDNFNLFCNLENLLYFHLGESGKNWNGKVVSFIDDCKLSLTDIYYNCDKKCNNIYYNKQCAVVQYGNSKNVYHDIWTCSDKMRKDIADFFKDSPHFKIAEIGAHKGYTTKIISKIFSKVYAVDNSVEWTNFNKNFNKDETNIEYVMLDIYKDSWDILPDDIEVSFIDAVHSYEGCKSDIMNSIKRFTNLQYIIFDDYGVWNGVKQIVDELIKNKVLVFERFIGITNVPGPNGLVKNVHEGIICRTNHPSIVPRQHHIARMPKDIIFQTKRTPHSNAVNHVNTHFTLSHILSYSKINRRATNIKHNK
jgi:hypothetical protein